MTDSSPPDDRLLTPAEVCELLAIPNTLLQDWRMLGKGPAFIRLGQRTVRYRKSAVEAFLAAAESGDA